MERSGEKLADWSKFDAVDVICWGASKRPQTNQNKIPSLNVLNDDFALVSCQFYGH